VILEADPALRALDQLRRRRVIHAEGGGNGGSAKKRGHRGKDVMIKVPVGTIVWEGDREDRQVVDLWRVGMQAVIARGGAGGRGNAVMATPTRQTPRIAERGLPGEEQKLRLELRLLAEVGLVGLPNAGKSSLLRAMSEARPKVGAYPFTTLEPHLGVVEVGHERLVAADIPGLVEGAHGGAGLGVKFLQHVRRTRVLVHVVDGTRPDPAADIAVVREELEAFGHGLVDKLWIVAFNKVDLPEARNEAEAFRAKLETAGRSVYPVSALTGEGVDELARAMLRELRAAQAAEPERAVVMPRPEAETAIEVQPIRGGFRVRGRRPSEVIAKLGVESEEARAEVARRLRRMGVASALRKAGVKPGDCVRIDGAELTWPL